MNATANDNRYEAQIRVEHEILFRVTGNNLDDLKISLSARCELEKSGAEGEIIELGTGRTIYHCRKQTIIDE